ncbi:hypothetical protein ACTMU2_21850 [Cupriavidus basilensis]
MSRRPKRPTLLQLQYRCVREAALWWAWAAIAGAANAANTILCLPSQIVASTAVCEPPYPIGYVIWPLLVIIGCGVGAWRFYRDHYCGDIWRDFKGI